MLADVGLSVGSWGGAGHVHGHGVRRLRRPFQATEESTSIHGVVLNAGNNRPVARALVHVEGRSVLTGYDGRFEFAGLSGTTTTVRVTKPGFYEGLDPYQTASKSVAVGTPDQVEVRLYPEALLTGTMTATNGDPLAQVQVQALRRIDDESGGRWTMAGQTSTNGDGQFRLPLPGGDYVVETQYMPERFGGAWGDSANHGSGGGFEWRRNGRQWSFDAAAGEWIGAAPGSASIGETEPCRPYPDR